LSEAFSGFGKRKAKKDELPALRCTMQESHHQSLLKRRQKEKIKKYQQKLNRTKQFNKWLLSPKEGPGYWHCLHC